MLLDLHAVAELHPAFFRSRCRKAAAPKQTMRACRQSLRRRWVHGDPLPMRFGLLPHDNTHTAAAACVAVRPL
jgi:hypothetical protein